MEMDHQQSLLLFLSKAGHDQRISKAHLAVYMALYYLWSAQGFQGRLWVYSWQLMPLAKISTCGTYYMVIGQLAEYGYLRYEPSFYRKRGSMVDLQVSPSANKDKEHERRK